MPVAIQQFRDNILADVPGCPIPRVDRAVVDAARRLCEDTFILEKTIEATGNPPVAGFPFTLPFVFGASVSGEFYIVTIDLDDYTILDDLDPIMPIFFTIDGTEWTLQQFDLDNEVKSLEHILRARKKFFRFVGRTIEIFPFLSDEGEIDVLLTLAVKPSFGVTVVPDVLYNDASIAIEALASYNLQKMPKRPWTDFNSAGHNHGIYNIEIGRHGTKRTMGGAANAMRVRGGYF